MGPLFLPFKNLAPPDHESPAMVRRTASIMCGDQPGLAYPRRRGADAGFMMVRGFWMLRHRLLLLVATAVIFSGLDLSTAEAARPCGPEAMQGPLRFLIPQGVMGADFRPACGRHDACYDKPGANRAACDRRYLRDMECACNRSRHPRFCRFVARVMYTVTSNRGHRAFRRAQSMATGTILAN